MAIRILVVDDHSVVRQGIITLLEDEPDIQIVGEATDGDEVSDSIRRLNPDVVLLDLTMPRMSGIEVIKEVVPEFPKVKILVFSMHSNADYILSAVKSGAVGYLLKDTSREEILKAVRSVFTGELYFPPSTSSVIIRNLMRQLMVSPVTAPNEEEIERPSVWKVLSAREQQILQCLTEGLSSKEIGEKFDISANTVANQRASIMKKTNVKNTAELISMALKEPRRR